MAYFPSNEESFGSSQEHKFWLFSSTTTYNGLNSSSEKHLAMVHEVQESTFSMWRIKNHQNPQFMFWKILKKKIKVTGLT